MSESLEARVKDLRNFRLRTNAIQALIDAGEASIEPLLSALPKERNGGAKWAMINILGEIGDERVVPELAPCLREDDYRGVTHEALMKITGQDCGDTPDGWLAWHKKQAGSATDRGKPEAAPESEPAQPVDMPFDRLVAVALENEKVKIDREHENDFSVHVSLPDGRNQRVRIAAGKHDHEGSKIIIIYTECGPAESKLYETILRKNLQMPYGSVAIRDIDGKPCFVMFNTLLEEGLSPVALRKSVMSLAERADKIEKVILKGEDTH